MSDLSQALKPLEGTLLSDVPTAAQEFLTAIQTAAGGYAAKLPATPAGSAEALAINTATGLLSMFATSLLNAELAKAHVASA